MHESLPIDALLPDLVAELARAPTVILQAAPGAGKTTRVPPALLNVVDGQILVLEPRRLAARLSAERVAAERGEACGQTIGFQVRFTNVSSRQTRVKFITEGLFLRLLLSDPLLPGVGCVILDEFHERHIHTDVALALLKHLQATCRPDLKIVLMSATLNATALGAYLPEARVFVSEGRVFPVTVEHLPRAENKPLEFQIHAATNALLADPRCPGHILVFLPGAADIRRAAGEVAGLARAHGAAVFELRADLPYAEQQKIFAPGGNQRKIILSTNVAETSLTIDGVTGVIDSGLAKIAGHAAWSGMPTLDVKSVSQASCIQRAGRAGRTAPGVTRRLFTQFDFNSRPAFEKPEIQRSDLVQILLELKLASASMPAHARFEIDTLPWFDPPSAQSISAGEDLLKRLGALDANGQPTARGHEIAKYPLHPRLGRALVEGKKLGKGGQLVLAVSLLNEGMIFRRGVEAPDYAHSDVSYQAACYQELAGKKQASQRAQNLVDMVSFRKVETLVQSLCNIAGVSLQACLEPIDEQALEQSLIAGFPDRVAQVRSRPKGSTGAEVELNLCLGGGALLSKFSVVRDSELLLALEAEESRTGTTAANAAQIRVAQAIEKEMLVMAGDSTLLREANEYYWDDTAKRARAAKRLYYGSLVIEEQHIHTQSDVHFEDTLRKALQDAWPLPFEDGDALEFYKVRGAILAQNGLSLTLPDFAGEEYELLLCHICEGKKSFAEIAERDLGDYMADLLSPEARRALDELAPEKITIGAGRKVRVHYEDGKPPWIASRLQDFFGTLTTPRIARGRLGVVVHLLAPNGQAVQVTGDLEGFWERVYPSVRKELCRKYPRQSWPEDPKTALPPEPRPPRRPR